MHPRMTLPWLMELCPQLVSEYCQQREWTFIHASTDCVFQGDSKDPYTEESIPDATSVYW